MIIWTTNEADYPSHSFLYVSKLGSDANAGTKAAPLLTINAAIAIAEADAGYVTELIAIVIGEGVWSESWSSRTKRYKFIGDVMPVIDSKNGSGCKPNLYSDEWIINFEIINYPENIDYLTYNAGGNWINDPRHFKNIVAEYLFIRNTWLGAYSFYYCQIGTVRWGIQNYGYLYLRASNCIFGNIYYPVGNANENQWRLFYNNIVLGRVVWHPNVSINNSDGPNDFNNFVANELFLTTDGTIDGPFEPLLSNAKFLTSIINTNSISADPEFNNETLGDYTLKETSPCLLAGLNRVSIGVYNRGWPHYSFTEIFRTVLGAEYSESYVGATLERDIVVDLEEGSFELEDGHDTGVMISAIGSLGTPNRVDRIESLIDLGTDVDGYHTNLPVWSDFLFAAYDDAKKYFEGDTITEGGVKYICILDYPNESPFVEYQPASSPTYWAVSTIPTATNVVPNFLFRYGNLLAEVNAADWKLMPFKGDFKVDENGKGSADPDYDAATGRYLTFSRYQFKLKLKNL